ncbi:60s acidic ribosomal protein [Cystoisospora suis]|uniref:60s acidic ribosomal protein n=1 Tax=Cystoisospora suis TaxID=483139 RepID=A0A2C6LB69_9APIC|nr:60s acidic ribosomal protein [Cystoisospora suis]
MYLRISFFSLCVSPGALFSGFLLFSHHFLALSPSPLPPTLLSTMAAVATASIPEAQKQELLCTYAALILNDDKLDITAENISKLITASGNSVEPYMPTLFARALQGQNIGQLLTNAGSCAAAAPAAGGAAGGAAPAGGAAAAKEEKKEEPEEEEEDDMGFSLFD